LAVCFVFIALVAIAVVKMYKLKVQDKKLMQTNAFKEVHEFYKDFTCAHLYDDV